MFLSRRILYSASLAVPLMFALSCGSAHDSDEYYVFVSANLQVSYWKAAGAGFANASGQYKVRSDFAGPQNYDPRAERDALDQAVQKKATGILLAVTDPRGATAQFSYTARDQLASALCDRPSARHRACRSRVADGLSRVLRGVSRWPLACL